MELLRRKTAGSNMLVRRAHLSYCVHTYTSTSASLITPFYVMRLVGDALKVYVCMYVGTYGVCTVGHFSNLSHICFHIMSAIHYLLIS